MNIKSTFMNKIYYKIDTIQCILNLAMYVISLIARASCFKYIFYKCHYVGIDKEEKESAPFFSLLLYETWQEIAMFSERWRSR